MVRKAREMAIGDFQENCLAVLDEVMATGEEMVLTNQGHRVAPVEPAAPVESLRGASSIKAI